MGQHESEDGKWAMVESAQPPDKIRKETGDKQLQDLGSGLGIGEWVTPDGDDWDTGMVGSLRARHAKQRAELAAAREFYKHRLSALTHQLGAMVTVANKKADLNVATALAQIDADYLEQLQKLDIENYDKRASLQQDLMRRTARQLEAAQAQDAPQFLKDNLIRSIVRQHEQAIEKISGGGAVPLEEV